MIALKSGFEKETLCRTAMFGSGIVVINKKCLYLGENVYIGDDCYINCIGGVAIGDYTIISRRCTIYSYDHNFKNPQALPYDFNLIKKPVKIGKYVWVGMNATIAPGTQIGDGAVIGIGTTVAGTIPENAVVVGSKNRIIGYRDEEQTKKLVEAGAYFFE